MTETTTGRALGPAFRNLFTANLASSLGDGIARIAAPLLAVRLTDDPLLISGIAALALLPWLFFAIPAGILIDRIDRRRALALANGVRTALAATLFLLTWSGSLTIWWLYVVIFVYGAFETVYDGAIRAVVPSVVARPNLPSANARIEAGELVVQNFLAGPFTSILFAVSALIPLGVNAAVFALACALAFFLPAAAAGRHATRDPDRGPSVRWHRQLADGFRFLVGNRMLVKLWLLSTFMGIAANVATAVWALFVLEGLGVPEAWFGIFMLSGAVGGILGSMVSARLKSWLGAGLVMAITNLTASLAFLFVGLVPAIWSAALGFAVSSASITIWNVLVMSLRQSIIPSRLLGRVHGTWRTLLWGAMPFGALLGGILGRLGLEVPLVVGGAASVVAALLFFRFLASLPNPEDVRNGDEDEVDRQTTTPIEPPGATPQE
ncbi:MFS transporter [Lysobacter korlensis]|uniref:MFS transporter n=1 Tax=Lysobacter korlensis TaxID=553636 RepID=A0ABV6RVJ0_9GAMM